MKTDPLIIRCITNMSYTSDILIQYLGVDERIVGDLNRGFSNIASTRNVDAKSLDWVHRNCKDPWSYLLNSKAGIIIMPLTALVEVEGVPLNKTLVFAHNPMLLFSRIARELFVERPIPGIHPSAVIHPNASIAKDVYIGPLCCIGACKIGEGTVIQSHVSIEDNVSIGKRVLIKNGARIGQAGFGFVKNENGELEKFPQVGKVIIEDNVEIGANTCVDRGALSVTRIGAGTKIDNLVQIAHNVQIGSNCVITGNVSIGGSSEIGSNVWVGPSAIIRDGVKVGSDAFINMGAVVIKNVKSGDDVIGYPAESKEQFVGKRTQIYKLYKERIK